MIPVRKPGRPLSTCPCPPGRPCACGGVRVAIPKKQKCSCPGDAATGTDKSKKEQPATEPPKSPSKPPSYRVGKQNGNSRTNGRKHSIDPTALERIDPSQINLITAPLSASSTNGVTLTGSPSIQNGHVDPTGFGPGFDGLPAGPNPYVPPQQPNYSTPVQFNMGFHYTPPAQLQHGHGLKLEDGFYPDGGFGAVMLPPPLVNGNHAPSPPLAPVNGSSQPAMATPKVNGANSGGGSCCSNTAGTRPSTSSDNQVPQQVYPQSYAPQPTPVSSCCAPKPGTPPPASGDVQTPQQAYGQPYAPQPTAVKSCCGGSAQSPPSATGKAQQPQQDYTPSYAPPQSPPVGSCCANKTQKSVSATDQAAPSQQQVFGQSYMSQFQYPTIFRYPGDYGSWQHPIDPFIWQQVMSQTAATMPMGTTPMSPTTAPAAATAQGDATVDMGISHQCSCGEGCQCVGCLAHPFNPQMFQYVNNAYSGSNTNSPGAEGTATGAQTQPAAGGDGQNSPTEAATPAVSEGSPPREEQSLSSLDYFFVNLPLSGICGGSLESCPCGDSYASPLVKLPFNAHPLSHRHDLSRYRPLFARYLDLHKRLDMDALDDTEVRGRWKSFVGKWNRGELAEGWYDPVVLEEAVEEYGGGYKGGYEGDSDHLGDGDRGGRTRDERGGKEGKREGQDQSEMAERRRHGEDGSGRGNVEGEDDEASDSDDEDAYLPPPPPQPGQANHLAKPPSKSPPPSSSTTTTTPASTRAPGPSIPTTADLTLRDEALAASRSSALTQHRLARRAHRAEQKALLDELLPARADPGTRERRLEKRRALNEKLKAFRDKSPDDGGGEDEDAVAGGGGGLEEYKAMLKRQEERRRERVSRREEMERAKRAEREERVREYREREERVMEGLRELARMRFGGGKGVGGGS
ncbi:hypothetical protein VTJ49DRAFT_4327 [Mycothermus thermophilus]|uniref:BZIP domain-containing protein n=1 Tax=Humicola insolens TaxID=85995 RepID=A0ABR3V5N0_HUMIN